MNILIIGCGRLGSRLANVLDSQGHEISIVDINPNAFDLLDDNFSGLTVVGNPIDLDVMRSAGVEGCEYVVCVTDSDNANIMSGQIARNIFHMEHIMVRILDPIKAQIYDDLGIFAICPTSLAFEAICSGLFDASNNKLVYYGGATIEMSTVPYDKRMKGKRLSEIEKLARNKLMGTIDENNQITLYSHDVDREIRSDDRLLFAQVIN